MFGPSTPEPPQGGFDFQREIATKKLKQDFSKPFVKEDSSGSIEKSTYRVYPQTETKPARFYVDQTGAAIFSGAIKASGGPNLNAVGLYLDAPRAQRLIDVFRAGPKTLKLSPEARGKLNSMADDLEKAMHENPKGVLMADASTGKPLAEIKGTVYHESAHGEQLAIEGPEGKPLFDYTKTDDIPNFYPVARALAKRGYSRNAATVTREILSAASERTYDKETGKNSVGLNKDEMADTVAAIVEKAVAEHGEKAYTLINQMAPEFRAEVKAKVKAKEANAK